jgi:hypothetical protein
MPTHYYLIQESKKYEVGVATNGTIFTPNSIEVHHSVEELKLEIHAIWQSHGLRFSLRKYAKNVKTAKTMFIFI